MNGPGFRVRLLRALAGGLSKLGEAHVWQIFYKDLAQPLVPVRATVPVTIAQAAASDAAEMAALWSSDDPRNRSAADEEATFGDRFRAGSLCYVARLEGRIVAYDWIRPWTAAGAGGVPMVLADDEVYTTDAYTADAWRGHRIHPALNHAILERAQQEGYRIAWTMARADNTRSLPTLRRVGWTPSGTLLVFEPTWAPETQRWLALGSPYPMPVGRRASARVPSLAEFHEQQRFDGREALDAPPWSTVCRLRRGDESFLLTIVPDEHAAGVRTASAVERAWPGCGPPVVACNYADEAWMLTRDPGGTRLTRDAPLAGLTAMLETYARLQVRAAARAELLRRLPALALDGLVERLLDFLGRDTPDEPGVGPAGAAYFIGSTAARRLHERLEPGRAALERHIEAAKRLPVTLNHGNLEPENAALLADGSCVLIDWTWAASGPAGVSLHPLVGSCLRSTVLLPGGAGSAAGRVDVDPLLDHYLHSLAAGGYAPLALLRECLPAAITAGMVSAVLRLAGYPMEEPVQRQRIAERLSRRLEALLRLCELLQAAGRT